MRKKPVELLNKTIANTRASIVFSFALVLYLLPCLALAQPIMVGQKKKAQVDSCKHTLKEGVLLVRLKTRSNTIKGLMRNNQVKMATELKTKTEQFNQQVIKAFQSKYDYSKVLFFADTLSDLVRKGAFDKICWLNEKLQPDSSCHLKPTAFVLTAEFGNLNDPTLGVAALKVMNQQFEELCYPFPYLVRTYDQFPSFLRRSPEETVNLLNKRLWGKKKQ